jgi:hypothetical protein
VRLTIKLKKEITDAWATRFPEMSVYKPMWLLKRYGPILIGVCLDRDSGNESYLPISRVHNLCNGLDFISLTLSTELRSPRNNSVWRIHTKSHEKEWTTAMSELDKQSFVPLRLNELSLEQVISLYFSYVKSGNPFGKYSPNLFEDIFTILLYCGKSDEAMEHMNQFAKTIDTWEPRIVEKIGGGSRWKDGVLQRFPSPEKIINDVERLVEVLDLKKLRQGTFSCR